MNGKVGLLVAGVVFAGLIAVWGPGRGGKPAVPVSPVMTLPSPQPMAAPAAPQGLNMAMAVDTTPGEPPMVAQTQLPNYVARKLKVFEGHWQGLDGRILTSELARKLNYPSGVQGVLLGEVTLAAANAGLLGGDVIVSIDEMPVVTMEDLQTVTKAVAQRSEARVTVLRKDSRATGTSVLRRLTVVVKAEGGLGFAQLEGAPMILPGDPRPHGYRGACTECHPIGQGFELTPDPDLISLPPPQITSEIAAAGRSPHEDRGPCEACHIIK
ncbi:MAG TPA: PDZ domain-containing protein [Rhodospirillaceae bacterium]|nr:PDZ domain-containing protein [Rhodospirillaceae bacterium]